jgi:ribulose-5-phosphate 4-epimerase/fuculose-1-phosphate aldolase
MTTSGGPVDRATLEDLAAASRILADQGVFDAAGHVSMRHPGHAERFLMSRSLAPQMVQADDIMEFDLDCTAVDPRGRNGFIERYLHGEIYRARPDVMAVAHSHSPSVIAFSLSDVPMRAMYHNAAFLAAERSGHGNPFSLWRRHRATATRRLTRCRRCVPSAAHRRSKSVADG